MNPESPVPQNSSLSGELPIGQLTSDNESTERTPEQEKPKQVLTLKELGERGWKADGIRQITDEEKNELKSAFGDAIEKSVLYKIPPEEIGKDNGEYLRVSADILEFKRNDYNSQPLLDTVIYSMDIPAVARAWESAGTEQLLKGRSQREVIVDNIIRSLRQGEIDAKSWVKILNRYDEVVQETRDWFKEKSEELKVSFTDSFIKKMNPKLSNPKTREDVERILKDVICTVKDPLNAPKNAGATTHGGIGYITFASIPILRQAMYEETETGADDKNTEYFTNRLESIMVHEFLHAITASDLMILRRNVLSVSGERERVGYPDTQWLGLAVGHGTKRQFTWVNEALTENCTGMMTGREPVEYTEERRTFKSFCTKGVIPIDEQLFIDAYFEQKTYEAKEEGASYTHWKAMMEAIRKAYPHDPQFFVKFDAYYTEYGPEAAEKLMENWDPNNPTKI